MQESKNAKCCKEGKSVAKSVKFCKIVENIDRDAQCKKNARV